MRRPLVCALFYLIAGILAGRHAGEAAGFGAVLFFAAAIGCCVYLYIRFKWHGAFIFLIFGIAGFFLILQSVGVKDAGLNAFAASGETLTMNGIVQDVRPTKTGGQIIVLRLKTASGGGMTIMTDMDVQAVLSEGERVACGQDVTLSGKLEFLQPQRNPGGFDEYLYNKTRRIQYKTFPIVVAKGGVIRSSHVVLHDVRNKLSGVYDAVLPEREAAVLKSMVIGDKSGLDDDIVALYRQTGIYHIMAISGLHIAIIAFFLNWLLSRLFLKKVSGALTIVFLIVYCMLTGSGVSTVRAVVMYGVIVSGGLLGRSGDTVTSASFAAICLLLYQPMFLWDIGFQYSFSAVYGLAICARPIERGLLLFRKKAAWIAPLFRIPAFGKSIAGCVAATLATVPVVTAHFYYVQPYAVFANMFVLPTIALTTGMGFLVGLTGLVFPKAAVFIAGIPFITLRFYETVCKVFTSLPFSVVLTGRAPIWFALGWFAVLGLLVYTLNAGEGQRQRRKHVFYCAALALMFSLCAYDVYPRPLQVALLDVGQGDCIVINKDKATFVIDGGGSFMREIGDNTGVHVMAPYLDYEGLGAVNAAFVTHCDKDHISGVIELLDSRKVGKLFLSAEADEHTALRDLIMQRADANHVPVELIRAGDVIEAGALTFTCLYPFDGAQSATVNDTSLVLKLTYKQASFLFTGDIDGEAERKIINAGADISADVLKLAHHGSKYSSTPAFIEKAAPQAAVVSTSAQNPYGHPHPDVLRYFGQLGVPVYNTAENGAVIMKTDGKSIRIRGWTADRTFKEKTP